MRPPAPASSHTLNTASKLGLLACLYLAQGLPYGFFTQALPVMMREEGHSLTEISLTSLLALPWALKFVWAPVVDTYGSPRFGRRRSWLVPLQLSAVALLALLSLLDPAMLGLILVGVLLTNLIAATQDIATDGLAVELLSHEERGLGNGVQVAGYRLGMILGGGVLLILFEDIGWSGLFLTMAGVMALITLPILLYREPPPPPAALAASKDGFWRTLLSFVRRPDMGWWLLLLVAYKGPDAMASAVLRPFLVDQGLTMGDIGWLLGLAGFTAGLVGALVGGVGVHFLGRRRALVAFGVVQALAVGTYVLPTVVDVGWNGLVAIACLETFAGGMATAALFTVMMDACDPSIGGTDYTVQASVVVIGAGLLGTLAGPVAEVLGYTGHFVFSALLTLAALAWIARVLFTKPGVAEVLGPAGRRD